MKSLMMNMEVIVMDNNEFGFNNVNNSENSNENVDVNSERAEFQKRNGKSRDHPIKKNVLYGRFFCGLPYTAL